MKDAQARLTGGDPDAARMTLGEHLDELRRCVLRSLVALVLACVICIYPAKYLLALIARPVILALRRHGQPDSFLATSPVEAILVYIKVVLLFGVIFAAPVIIHQLWSFVATGLYPRERQWIYRLVPASVGLFLAGVLFMYTFVLIVSLNFLVGFGGWLPLPNPQPNLFERHLLGVHRIETPETQPAIEDAPRVPLLDVDPEDPPVGALWVNVTDAKLKVQWPEGPYSVQLLRSDQRALVTTHFRIGEYLSFVLILTIAFGLAFQMPLVVLFVVRAGIVSVQILRSYRRVVILIIVIIAGVLAPPDLLSHLMLSVPMIVLFEIGLLLAARPPRPRPEAS
jgi:Sec-independent protein secretion pathway component TatC